VPADPMGRVLDRLSRLLASSAACYWWP